MKTPRLTASALLLSLACLAGLAGAAPHSGLDLPGMDRAVRPQDDLFRAGNGHWLATTEIPADKSSFGMVAQLRDLSDQRVRALVEGLAKGGPKAGSAEHKVGAYYASFMDTAAIDKAGLTPVKPLLDGIQAIQTREQLAAWLGRQNGITDQPLTMSVDPDFKQPGINRLTLNQSGLGLPDRDYYLKADDDARMAAARTAYQTYLQALARAAGLPEGAAARAYAIEQRLAEAQWPAEENRDPQKIYNPMTPADAGARRRRAWTGTRCWPQPPCRRRTASSSPSPATPQPPPELLAEAPLDDLRRPTSRCARWTATPTCCRKPCPRGPLRLPRHCAQRRQDRPAALATGRGRPEQRAGRGGGAGLCEAAISPQPTRPACSSSSTTCWPPMASPSTA